MCTRVTATLLFLFSAFVAICQPDTRNTLTGQQVTKLANLLHEKIEDTTRFKVQIRLAKYFFEKGLGGKADIDSVTSLIRQAKEINTKRFAGKQQGLIQLYEATLARKKGNSDLAKQLVKLAINEFKISNGNFQLAEAYLELSRNYNSNDPKQAAFVRIYIDILFQIVPRLIPRGELDSCMATLRNFYLFNMYSDDLAVQMDYLDHFARACQTLNDKNREFWARRETAYVYYQKGDLNTAISKLLEVAKEQKAGNYAQICYTYNRLSYYYYIATDYKKSMFYSLEATKHVHDALDSAYLGQLYELVVVNYRQRGSIAEAVEWNLKMVNYMNATRDYSYLYSTLFDLVRDMLPLDRANEALKIITENARKSPPQENWERIVILISLAQVYEALHNYTAAEKYSEELGNLIEDLLNRKEIIPGQDDVRAYQYLATFYLNTGKYDRSETYFKKTMAVWPKSAQTQGREFEHRFLYRLDSARGDYRSAFEHFRTWHKVLDSALSVTKAKEFDEIQTAYKTEQKDSLIKLKEQNIQLLTRQDQLQRSKLQQGMILRNISFAVVTLLIIITTLLYNRYRLKQRTNRKLELQGQKIEKQNLSLHHLVNEKEWLLKEIHHRVKNNLQIVMSLLNSQSAYIDNPYALTAIHDSQHRVNAMSLIHQKLYGSENVSTINMSTYIRELVSYLRDSFNTGQRIRFDLAIEPIEMDVSQAVPLGLILNEAITNSIKYAFPNDRNGVISISLLSTIPHHYLLSVSDDGIGMPLHINNKKVGSLGMSLMEGLGEDLNGKFSIESDNGTTINLLFVHDSIVKRHETLAASLVSNNQN
jgi:two-component system, sensor histidine kinase PdtaS